MAAAAAALVETLKRRYRSCSFCFVFETARNQLGHDSVRRFANLRTDSCNASQRPQGAGTWHWEASLRDAGAR